MREILAPRRWLTGVVVILVAATITACGSADEPTGTGEGSAPPVATVSQSPAETADPAAADAIATYMDAVASFDPDLQHEAVAKTSAPDSVAAAYMTHLAHQSEAYLDGGLAQDAFELNETDDGYELANYSETVTFADFKTTNGRVADFTVNGRSPGPLLTVGNGDKVRGGGATFEFLSAYRTITENSLVVTVKVTSTKPITLNLYSSIYRDPRGKQREASDATGAMELAAKSNTVVALVFQGSRPGGTVTMTGSLNDFYDDYTVKINVG